MNTDKKEAESLLYNLKQRGHEEKWLDEFKHNPGRMFCAVHTNEDFKIGADEFLKKLDGRLKKLKRDNKIDNIMDRVETLENIDVLSSKMEELREILNTMCISDSENYEDILYVSQCLDKVIVSYINLLDKQKNIV